MSLTAVPEVAAPPTPVRVATPYLVGLCLDAGAAPTEPGRGIVGDAGTLVAEVIGVTWRDGRRWVTVDAGLFSGLIEALDEEIRYRLSTERDGDASGPPMLAGPTCDSLDLLYERTPVRLPHTLSEGDRVLFHSAGAYSSAVSTVGFNGFPALPTVLV